MNWCLYVVLLLCLCGIRPCIRVSNKEYISKDAIQPVKGLFILLVFLSHFRGYIPRDLSVDGVYTSVQAFLGQMIVVPFLFYSGYGVSESLRLKGWDYLVRFPVHRVLNVVFQFAIAVLIYIAYRSAFMGAQFPLKRMLLCLVGWNSAGNSNWYIFSIVIMYLLTWVAHWAFGHKTEQTTWMPNFVLTGMALVLIDILSYCRPDYVYNTLFAYVAGCWYSQFRCQFEGIFEDLKAVIVAVWALIVGYCMVRLEWKSTFICETASVLFALITVLITMRIRFRNPFLSYCGSHLFSLYVLQRLPMLALQKTALAQNRWAYCVSCLAITLVISWIFDPTIPRLWRGLLSLCRLWRS